MISFILIKYADLEKIKNSNFGKYLAKNMNGQIESIWLPGQVIMWEFAR
jgi:hypothetical protein